MQLSLLSDELLCLVLLLGYLVSTWAGMHVVYLQCQGSVSSAGAYLWGLRQTRTSQGRHCHHRTGTNPVCS
jgi:hypothetical protein